MNTMHYAAIHGSRAEQEQFAQDLRALALRLRQELAGCDLSVEPAPADIIEMAQRAASLPVLLGEVSDWLRDGEPCPLCATRRRLLVGCHESHPYAAACQRANPCAVWGGALEGRLIAAVWDGGRPAVWHEALHLVGASDCYETSNPGQRRHNCIMQWAPGPKDWLCKKTIAELRKHLSEPPTP